MKFVVNTLIFVILTIMIRYSIAIVHKNIRNPLRSRALSTYQINTETSTVNTSPDNLVSSQIHNLNINDEYFMKLAIRHAQFAFREKEVPIGAVLVDENGTVLSSGRNRVEATQDCTQHAEIEVIKRASDIKNNWRLLGCTLYTTLEPCAMCMGAIQAARIKRVVYSARDHRLGACGSWVDLVDSTKHPFATVSVTGGVHEQESAILLKRFFQARRRENLGNDVEYRGSSYCSEINVPYDINKLRL